VATVTARPSMPAPLTRASSTSFSRSPAAPAATV
jgi:hypothetical protein